MLYRHTYYLNKFFSKVQKEIAKYFNINITNLQDPLLIIVWCCKDNRMLIRQLRGYYDINEGIVKISGKGVDNKTLKGCQ
jgi:hypothetical protein